MTDVKVLYDLEFHFKTEGASPLYVTVDESRQDTWTLNQNDIWSITTHHEDGSSTSDMFHDDNVLRRKLVRREVPLDTQNWRDKLSNLDDQ